jgi:shikimate dehydrogenase
VLADDLATAMAALTAAPNVDGILVTMPHKRAIARSCGSLSERARLLGAISVMRRNPDGTWHGDMLDGLAFVKAQLDHGARIEGSRALLVGAGGAGSAIALALLDEGVRELVIHDADENRFAALAEALQREYADRVRSGPPDPTGFDLVFNSSPAGMDSTDPPPVDVTALTPRMFVGDVIAGHGPTALIAAAQNIGCRVATGGNMVEAVQGLMADFLLGADRTAE